MVAASYRSERLLSPYRGTIQVVETANADAVSRDGVRWSLYVHGAWEEVAFDDGGIGQVQLPDIKFGSWSRESGLQRAPVRNVTDYAAVDHFGSELLEAVKGGVDRLPFPLADCFELWLLDHEGRPIALLESRCEDAGLDEVRGRGWDLGQQARGRFGQIGGDPELVARTVNGQCAEVPMARWFRRREEGVVLPELPLVVDGLAEGRARRAVEAYLAWLAPSLLQLQGLSPETRRRLETQACRQPFEVARQIHLYPELLDRERLSAALVEARLREAAGERGEPDVVAAEVLPAFYIEYE